ncbi:MAG: oligosaccharide flippase family protein [Deltaproteobacteria bacterium]|nr:oligosaccharide flippase family protein [Deltaproteobacteria bacterium]
MTRKLLIDSFWALAGNTIGKGLALAASVVIARMLGKAGFGEFGIVKNSIIMIATFASFGLGYTATKMVAESRSHNDSMKIRQMVSMSLMLTIVFSTLAATLLFIFATPIAEHILQSPQLPGSLRIAAIWTVFNAVTVTQIGILSGFGEFKAMAKINAASGALTALFSLVGTYSLGLNGTLLGLILGQSVSCILNMILIKKHFHISTPNSTTPSKGETISSLLSFSLPIILQEATYSLSAWLTSIILVTYSTHSELGVYNAAYQWVALTLFVPGILRNVVLSHFSGAVDSNVEKILFRRVLLINGGAVVIPAVIIFLGAPYISTIYGDDYADLSQIVSLLIVVTVPLSLSNVYSQGFLSRNRNWQCFFIRLLRDVLLVALTMVFIVNFAFRGARAVSWSTVITSYTFLIAMAFVFHRGESRLAAK